MTSSIEIAAIAAGYYTSIEPIHILPGARKGEEVLFNVNVKNLHTEPTYLKVTGHCDGVDIDFFPDYIVADPGVTYFLNSSFTMPNKDCTLEVWSWYWEVPGGWIQDDYKYIDVHFGTITRMELEYDGARAAIPASNIPQGKSGLVHIWCRNDMETTQRMGLAWLISDPDDEIIEMWGEWEAWPYTGPGDEHEFIIGPYTLDKVGAYGMGVGLNMNHDDPQMVDGYSGILCTVAAVVPEPEFSGFVISEYAKQ